MVPWSAPPLEVAQHSTQFDSPELCSRAKTASPGRARAARILQLKSSNDPLALQTDVEHYRIELEVEPTTEFIDGRTTMAVRCVEDGVTAFRFSAPLVATIQEVELDGGDADWTRLDEAAVEVELARTCDTGEEFELVVDYEGYPVTTGLSSIVFATQSGWPVVSTLSEPWFSYTWWAVKEDSRDKATGELLITVPSQLSVVANGIRSATPRSRATAGVSAGSPTTPRAHTSSRSRPPATTPSARSSTTPGDRCRSISLSGLSGTRPGIGMPGDDRWTCSARSASSSASTPSSTKNTPFTIFHSAAVWSTRPPPDRVATALF